MTPVHPIVEALLKRLDSNLREAFEERAGIMQFEAGHPRELAEALAMLEVIRTYPLAVSGVAHLRAQVAGREVSILTTVPEAVNKKPTVLLTATPSAISLKTAVLKLDGVAVLHPL